MDEQASDKLPQLGSRAPDRLAAVLRAGSGMIPLVGSVIAEIVNELVPNQRADRIEKYLVHLVQEVAKCKIENVDQRLKQLENVDLLETGAFQSARALSDERLLYIAKAVAEGIAAEERNKINAKRILNLIGEIDDEEILILDAYRTHEGDKFAKLRPEPAYMGADREVIERAELYDAANTKLQRLSLIEKKINLNSKTKMPEFDVFSGEPKGYMRITPLGRLVLRRIGLGEDDD